MRGLERQGAMHGWTEIPLGIAKHGAAAYNVLDWRNDIADVLRKNGIEVRKNGVNFFVRDEVFGLLVLWYSMNDWPTWAMPGFPVRPHPAYAKTPIDVDGSRMHFLQYVEAFILPAQKKGVDEETRLLSPLSPTPS